MICDCPPSPTSPRIIPDKTDVAVEALLDTEDALDLIADGSDSVRKLQQRYEEAKAVARKTLDLLAESIGECNKKDKQLAEQEKVIEDVQQCLKTLT